MSLLQMVPKAVSIKTLLSKTNPNDLVNPMVKVADKMVSPNLILASIIYYQEMIMIVFKAIFSIKFQRKETNIAKFLLR